MEEWFIRYVGFVGSLSLESVLDNDIEVVISLLDDIDMSVVRILKSEKIDFWWIPCKELTGIMKILQECERNNNKV